MREDDTRALQWVMTGLLPHAPASADATTFRATALLGSAPTRLEHALFDEIRAADRQSPLATFAATVRREQARGASRDDISRLLLREGYSMACVRDASRSHMAAIVVTPTGGRVRCGAWVSADGFGVPGGAPPVSVRVADPAAALALLLSCRFGIFQTPPAAPDVCAEMAIAYLHGSETAIANARAQMRDELAGKIAMMRSGHDRAIEPFLGGRGPSGAKDVRDVPFATACGFLVLVAAALVLAAWWYRRRRSGRVR